ncbi:hypothetical protein AB0M05_30575 [Streptomyces violaceusniger]|uniref:hypothetical protein n=1 Tax=Streptomyces TaxID=1883 RepID=UPI000997CBC0|nr:MULTISPECIES: hypothetical protein [Streptomyces]AQW49092.1 hypothetical protein SHXM_02555 [Streptomyces hygroscopicus]ASQ98032.1 hypothetical protein CGL27_37900 [Streptomyces sp. 11-1-2]
MTTEPEQAALAVELAELRRSVDVGFTRVDGRLALLDHRGEQAEEDVNQLGGRMRILEHGRWPLPSIAALTGVSALALAIWQAAGH